MRWKVCFPINGIQRCFPIPVLLRKRPIKIPDPEPGPNWWLFDPDPLPWFEGKGIGPSVANDLKLLATMAQLADELSPTLKKKVGGALKEFSVSQVPKGMELVEH